MWLDSISGPWGPLTKMQSNASLFQVLRYSFLDIKCYHVVAIEITSELFDKEFSDDHFGKIFHL